MEGVNLSDACVCALQIICLESRMFRTRAAAVSLHDTGSSSPSSHRRRPIVHLQTGGKGTIVVAEWPNG